ncbi:hypothetical protein MRB53_036339 [Persea americana]|nr:hypothetical protein MRB53_036402 [Persea americana]KAJ8614926.1 hypothetical protein MRB53_036339 [Persea americana]
MALVAGVVGGLEAHQRDRMGESFLVVGWPATSSVGYSVALHRDPIPASGAAKEAEAAMEQAVASPGLPSAAPSLSGVIPWRE